MLFVGRINEQNRRVTKVRRDLCWINNLKDKDHTALQLMLHLKTSYEQSYHSRSCRLKHTNERNNVYNKSSKTHPLEQNRDTKAGYAAVTGLRRAYPTRPSRKQKACCFLLHPTWHAGAMGEFEGVATSSVRPPAWGSH